MLKNSVEPLQLSFLWVKAWTEREGEPASKKVQTQKAVDVIPFPSYYFTQVHPIDLRGLEPMETYPGREARYCREVWICLPTIDSCVSKAFARIFTGWGLGESRSSIKHLDFRWWMEILSNAKIILFTWCVSVGGTVHTSTYSFPWWLSYDTLDCPSEAPTFFHWLTCWTDWS